MTDRIAELKELCRKLQQESGVPESMADPFRLAEAHGAHIRYFPLGALKGFYIVVDGTPFIALNEDLPEPLQRIVCAHELGHHLLHRELAERTIFNDYDLYQMESVIERDANLFAAFLLIPEAVEDFCRPENHGLSVREAAQFLGATEDLFAIRLQAEGIGSGIRLSRFPES